MTGFFSAQWSLPINTLVESMKYHVGRIRFFRLQHMVHETSLTLKAHASHLFPKNGWTEINYALHVFFERKRHER